MEETDAAVARAKAAYPAWRAVAPNDRAACCGDLPTLVEEHQEELARIESRNVGKPIAGARGEIGMVANVFHFYAGAVDKHYGETIPVAGGVDLTFREPLGVVGLIVPVELPAQHRVLEARACARVRKHRRPEAGRADAALGAPARRARARGRDPGGRDQRARRQGLDRRRAPRRASGRREDRLHGLDGSRARDHARAPRPRSSASRSSSAASPRTSSSTTPTSRRRLQRRRTPSSTTPARTAARGRASSSRSRPTTAFWSCSCRRRPA